MYFQGAKYWVEDSAGRPFSEHQVSIEDKGKERVLSCFLEVTLGTPFAICCDIPKLRHDSSLRFFCDNIRNARKTAGKEGKSLKISAKRETETSKRPLIFSSLETTDEEDLCTLDNDYLMKLGTIEIEHCAGKRGERSFAGPFDPIVYKYTKPIQEPGKVLESSKKATTVGARTSFGAAIESSRAPMRHFDVDSRLPFNRVIFKYRTSQALVLLKVLDAPVVPEGEDVKPFGPKSSSTSSSGKRKAGPSGGSGSASKRTGQNSDEDVKPSKKSRPSVGSSKESAIDLTDL